MPRRQRTIRSRPTYSEDHRDHLLSGCDFFGGGFGDGANFREDDAIAAWEILRGELLVKHIAETPCTRPWAWWRFEEHEPRLCVSSPPRGLEDDDTHPNEPEDDAFNNFGVRSPYWDMDRGELLFESQAHYLKRYGLLTKGETRYLAQHPELLEPVKGWHARNR